jgi:predicted DNA binding protein/ActR/RegA family two-component response regulator
VGETSEHVTVLLVDDDERWARVTGRLLSERGAFTVETAHSLTAGRARFEELAPDCVVCDYQLGDGTGLALLETVRDADRELPFILVTGRGSEQVASDAIGRGVTDYIRKDRDDEQADLLASRVHNAVRTYRAERALERERRSKNAMLDIVTETTEPMALYRQFCSQLVEEQGYACAWIGTVDGTEPLTPQASAGRTGYVNAILDHGAGAGGSKPARRALQQMDQVAVQIGDDGRSDDCQADADGDDSPGGGEPASWQRTAREHGFESAAALPIRYEGVRFGVLSVYAADGRAVDSREREALAEYAETIGYALKTAERKRSLLAEQSVSVEIELTNAAVPLVGLAAELPADARIEVPSVVERKDGDLLYLARIADADREAIDDAVAAHPGLRLLDAAEADGTTRCELATPARTPESILAEHGARFERTVVVDGTATVSAFVAGSGAVSRVASALEAEFADPTVSTIWSDRPAGQRAGIDPLAELTDRQREILRHAFHDGYFERPRGSTATELAERLDIARATFTQHLRTAQRRVFEQFFGR